MLLVIDNYDSFTYNLVQLLGELGADPVVRRNDQITVAQIAAGGFSGLVISPGPGEPKGAGVSLAAIRELGGRLPILGVCLGHQAIGEAFGGRIVRAPRPVHGKASRVSHDGRGIFSGLPLRSKSRAITPWSSSPKPARPSLRSPPPPPTESSWACVTARCPSKASSSIPSPFSPAAESISSPTS